MKSIIIKENDSNQRLDKFLSKYLKNVPQSLLYKYIRLKRVKINGKKSEISYKLQLGDQVDLYINDELFADLADSKVFVKVKKTFDVVYEDENILLVDKQPGLLVHSDENEQVNTLIGQIQSYFYEKGEYRPEDELSFAPALCNRLDRNTGGLVIAAKNAETLRVMNEKIKNNEIDKCYLAIVVGILPNKKDTLRGYHFKDTKSNTCYIQKNQASGTKIAITEYEVLKEKDNLSLVKVRLITGRTHQIRVHFAFVGHPLLGDGKYGEHKINRAYGRFQQALYAYELKFDFGETPTHLDYLKGRSFRVEAVPFENMVL